jgi:hypothetical protein
VAAAVGQVIGPVLLCGTGEAFRRLRWIAGLGLAWLVLLIVLVVVLRIPLPVAPELPPMPPMPLPAEVLPQLR